MNNGRAPLTWRSTLLAPARRPIFLFLATLLGLLSLLAAVKPYWSGDIDGIQAVQSLSLPGAEPFLRGISLLGNSLVAVVMAVIAGIALWLRRNHKGVGLILLTPLAAIMVWTLKLAVDRPRPGAEVGFPLTGDFSGPSFPSGHVVYTTVFFGALIYVASAGVRRRWLRMLVQGVLAIPILFSGLSRIYLGAHWPTDVAAGYLLAAVLLWYAVGVYHERTLRRKRATPSPVGGESGTLAPQEDSSRPDGKEAR